MNSFGDDEEAAAGGEVESDAEIGAADTTLFQRNTEAIGRAQATGNVGGAPAEEENDGPPTEQQQVDEGRLVNPDDARQMRQIDGVDDDQ